jgi:CubicO group peptidase (beta-lactamase class C family)
MTERPRRPPGVHFVYSDINFILLGELVHRLSGQTLSDYAREHIFLPLGMKETMFQPPASLIPRIAPTERDGANGAPLRGVVHDPTRATWAAWRGTRAVLHRGRPGALLRNDAAPGRTRRRAPVQRAHGGEVHHAAKPRGPAHSARPRLGYRLAYSGNRGDLFPIGSYGHTGFTGTSIWIDPVSEDLRDPAGQQRPPVPQAGHHGLRGKVATIAAAALGIDAPGVALTGYNETITGAGCGARSSATP